MKEDNDLRARERLCEPKYHLPPSGEVGGNIVLFEVKSQELPTMYIVSQTVPRGANKMFCCYLR